MSERRHGNYIEDTLKRTEISIGRIVDKLDKIQSDMSDVRIKLGKVETLADMHKDEFEAVWKSIGQINSNIELMRADRAKETKQILIAMIVAALTLVGNIAWYIMDHLG